MVGRSGVVVMTLQVLLSVEGYDVCIFSFLRFSCFGFWMEWWMALYRRGPPIWWMTRRHTALASFFLRLRVRPTEQWSSVGALSNQLPQVITYHRYASLRETSSLEMGVVLHPHVSGLHQDRKVFCSLFITACFASFLP